MTVRQRFVARIAHVIQQFYNYRIICPILDWVKSRGPCPLRDLHREPAISAPWGEGMPARGADGLVRWWSASLAVRGQLGGRAAARAEVSALAVRVRAFRPAGSSSLSPAWLARATAMTPVRDNCLIP